jgi:hypothetical protein
MTVFYDREFPVSKWVVASGLTEKQTEAIIKAAAKKNAVVIAWPALEMPAELKKLAEQGYSEQINQKQPFFLDMTLALRAVVNITRMRNPVAQLSNKPAYHHICKNRIETDDCFVRLANEILAANDPITLCQVFNTADTSHMVYFTINGNVSTIRKIAKEVVTVGNGEEFDINLSTLFPKELPAALLNLF